MSGPRISTVDLVIAAVTGVLTALVIFPSVVAFLAFVMPMFVRTSSRIRTGRTRFATASLVVASLTFAGILACAAAYRPAKVVNQQLGLKISLPSTEMTLAELSYAATYDRQWLPIQVSFCFADDDKDSVIKWQQHDVTLRDFLHAIESQTVLRRRFMHCGNGYTVLGGGDCCLGLYIRDPELAIPPFPRERFDVHAYAQNRARRITMR